MPDDTHFTTGWTTTCRPSPTVPPSVRPASSPQNKRWGDDEEPIYERQTPSLMRYAEPSALDQLDSGTNESWSVMSLIEECRQGGVSAGSKMFPWNRQQIEAAWNTIIEGWNIGIVVAVDASDSDTLPVQKSFGPWRTRPQRLKQIRIILGAEKVAALAWSLNTDMVTSLQQRLSPEESAMWDGYNLVVEPRFRRIRFISGAADPRYQLPVSVLPDAGRCARAMTRMDITPVDREWVNRTARRLLKARIGVYLFKWQHREKIDQMIENLRQIGVIP